MAAAQVCTGDCNGDGSVTVDEAIQGVGIALGTGDLAQCPIFDVTGDGAVDVAELVSAVGKALAGCVEQRWFIRDAQGRALVLQGVNVMSSSKGDPLRMPSVDRDKVLRIARDWGFNLVRFLIFWDAAEPEPGVYDEDYFDRVAERLDWFQEAGIHVVLDMHQDVYSRVYCCDGAPPWAVRDDGLPFTLQSPWFFNYFEPAVTRAFDNFWASEGPNTDLQDHYVAMWVRVVERFRDHPAVIGYDIMNEPYPGSYFDTNELFGRVVDPNGPSAVFDREIFTPFYQRTIDAIRAVDTGNWIFYEPRYGTPASGLPSYLEPLEDPREGEPRLAYFPHLYSIGLELSGMYLRDADPTIPDWEVNRRKDARLQGAPLLLGEFGVEFDTVNGFQHIVDVVEMVEHIGSGWAYWSLDPGGFGFLDQDWNERANIDTLVRTYPQRIAGEPLYYDYNPETRFFWLAFNEKEGVQGATEIYIPARRYYPDGWDLWLSDEDGRWSQQWDDAREVLSVTTDPGSEHHLIILKPAVGAGEERAGRS